MRHFIVTILSLNAFITFGQELTTWDIDSIATLEANELLESNRADEVLIYNSGCVGCEVLNACSCYDGYSMTYLLWKENSKIWVSEINCCNDIETRELKNSEIWKTLQTNKEEIINSVFKEDYIVVHNDFWHLKVLPTHPKEIRIYDYYFEDDHKFQAYNKEQYAYRFLRSLSAAIGED